MYISKYVFINPFIHLNSHFYNTVHCSLCNANNKLSILLSLNRWLFQVKKRWLATEHDSMQTLLQGPLTWPKERKGSTHMRKYTHTRFM